MYIVIYDIIVIYDKYLDPLKTDQTHAYSWNTNLGVLNRWFGLLSHFQYYLSHIEKMEGW